MNFTEIIDIITTSRNPLKIFSLLSNSYSLIAQELNNFSENLEDKLSENGYVGGLLYSLGKEYKTPSNFYADQNYKTLFRTILSREEFKKNRLPTKFCQGVFARYQWEISEEILKKVDEEYLVYREKMNLEWRINKLKSIKKEERTAEQGKEIAMLIKEKKQLAQKNATGITGEQYKKQALFYKGLQETFQLIFMLSENAFAFVYFPFLIDRLNENLSDLTHTKLDHVGYLMKFHFCRTYSEYITLHSFFSQLYQARHPVARWKKYVGLVLVYFLVAFFLPMGVSICVGAFFLHKIFKSFVFGANRYNIPVTTLSIFGLICVLFLSLTVFQWDFYKRAYYRYQPVFNHLMVGTPYDYFDWFAETLKSNLGEAVKNPHQSSASYSKCLWVDYLKGESCR